MEKRKEKRIRSEVPARSGKRRKTRNKKEENVVLTRRGTRKYGGLTCHQCKVLMSSKTDLVFCSICIKTRYCYDCISRWYPKRTPAEVQAACPFCMGNCNCKACLRDPLAVKIPIEKDADVKLKQLQYLLVKVLPVLRDIYAEQKHELEIETAIKGVPVTEASLIQANAYFGSKERESYIAIITMIMRRCDGRQSD